MSRVNFLIPISIVVAGALIAGAVYFSGGGGNTTIAQVPQGGDDFSNLENMRPVSGDDHIRGDLSAPVKVVEYSDFECPFCKRFHSTMQQVMEEYGTDGQVAWVYRHFPLDQLHPVKARTEAMASECVNELGGPGRAGNDAFWQFTDRFFELTPSNNQTDIDTILPQIVSDIGLDVDAFNTCLESGKYAAHIDEDIRDAMATGGNGTPWSIVVAQNGKAYPLSGAQPYASIKQLIELALEEN
jgi:protein-disulfide isomerase